MKKLHTDILDLRSKGYSYKAIIKELGCSKGLISWVCNQKIPKEQHFQQIQEAIRISKPLVSAALVKARVGYQ